MPHAVLVIAPSDRARLSGSGYCLIRSGFRALAHSLVNTRIVLYQSGRGRIGADISTGYFATAALKAVYSRADDPTHCIVSLQDVVLFEQPQRIASNGQPLESGLANRNGRLSGWKAAEDIREISADEYRAIVGEQELTQFTRELQEWEETSLYTPTFYSRSVRVRDPLFSNLIYVAYGGKCAISGITLSNDGLCALQAAHIYPDSLLPRDSVNSGILLAPTWHDRYDIGLVTIHDDYSWTATVEDCDTLAITDRRLRLPELRSDWPDVELIARNRFRLLNSLPQRP